MLSFLKLESQKYDEFSKLKENNQKIDKDPYIEAKIEACLELKNAKFNPNERDEEGVTILSYIIHIGRLDLVKFLVEAGADVNLVSYDEMTFPLAEAARFGWQDIYDYLAPLTNPKLVNIAQQDLAEGLVYQKRLNRRNEQVENLINAVNNGNLENVINCIKGGVDVNAIGFHYSSGLHQACFYANVSIIQALLSAGADPNLKDERDKKTPLMTAIDTIYDLYIKLDLTDIKIEIVKTLIEAGADVNATDKNGNSVLIDAINSTKKGVIPTILIEAGADVNSQNDVGLTALMMAAGGWAISKEYIEILLKAKADIELKDERGKTALIYTIREPKYLEEKTLQLEKIKLLIQAGAKVNTQDNNGNTALSLAKEAGNTEIIKLLKDAGAKED